MKYIYQLLYLCFTDDYCYIKDERTTISALELIVQNAHVELITHPRVIDLVNKKWNCFAQRIFFQQFIGTLFYLLVFLITTILDHSRMGKVS